MVDHAQSDLGVIIGVHMIHPGERLRKATVRVAKDFAKSIRIIGAAGPRKIEVPNSLLGRADHEIKLLPLAREFAFEPLDERNVGDGADQSIDASIRALQYFHCSDGFEFPALRIGESALACLVAGFGSEKFAVMGVALNNGSERLQLPAGFTENVCAFAAGELLPGLIDRNEAPVFVFPEDRIWIEFDQIFGKAGLVVQLPGHAGGERFRLMT